MEEVTGKNPSLPLRSSLPTKQWLFEPVNLVSSFIFSLQHKEIYPSSKRKQFTNLCHLLDLQPETVIQDKEGYLMMLKESMYQEDIKILNICAFSHSFKICETKPTEPKEEI